MRDQTRGALGRNRKQQNYNHLNMEKITMMGFAPNVKSSVTTCTIENLYAAMDAEKTAHICAEIEDALESVKRGEMAREDFGGVQLSGFSWTSADMRGIQLGALGNVVRGDGVGAQISLANAVGGDFIGLQAGCVNAAGAFAGVQFGVANWDRLASGGVQLAVYNMDLVKFSGFSLGLVNVAEDFVGAQFGVINCATSANGVQLGLVNVAENMSGVQIGAANLIATSPLPVMVIANMSF